MFTISLNIVLSTPGLWVSVIPKQQYVARPRMMRGEFTMTVIEVMPDGTVWSLRPDFTRDNKLASDGWAQAAKQGAVNWIGPFDRMGGQQIERKT